MPITMTPIEAIDALQSTLADTRRRLDDINQHILLAKTTRKELLDARVQELLPALSKHAENNLVLNAPDFIAREQVQAAFKNNRPFLGLFKRRTHDSNLLLLRIQFKCYLESSGLTQQLDKSIVDAEQLKNRIASHQSQLTEWLGWCQQAHSTNTPLPQNVMDTIARITNWSPKSSTQSKTNRVYGRGASRAPQQVRHLDYSCHSMACMFSTAPDIGIQDLTNFNPDNDRGYFEPFEIPDDLALDELAPPAIKECQTQLNVDPGFDANELAKSANVLEQIRSSEGENEPTLEIAADDSLGAFS